MNIKIKNTERLYFFDISNIISNKYFLPSYFEYVKNLKSTFKYLKLITSFQEFYPNLKLILVFLSTSTCFSNFINNTVYLHLKLDYIFLYFMVICTLFHAQSLNFMSFVINSVFNFYLMYWYTIFHLVLSFCFHLLQEFQIN